MLVIARSMTPVRLPRIDPPDPPVYAAPDPGRAAIAPMAAAVGRSCPNKASKDGVVAT